MRDGILNGFEYSLGMENLVTDFVVSIGVTFFDTSESLGGGLIIDPRRTSYRPTSSHHHGMSCDGSVQGIASD